MTLLGAIGWTLIHFLWQGAIIAAVYAAFDAVLRRSSARARYGLAAVAMTSMFGCAVVTFIGLAPRPGETIPAATAAWPVLMTTARHAGASAATPDYLPWLVYVWMLGVSVLSLRLAVQWVALQSCRRNGISPVNDIWRMRLDSLARRLGLRRAVRLYESSVADVPAVVGWLRPVVLVPASALTRLTPDQVEALLIHELAHILRHDYAVNLLQSCVETLFFYHPCVWWVSRRMRQEREHCCDDLAVAACGSPIVYVRALAELEHLRAGLPHLAMAATSGSLLHRIERLLKPGAPSRTAAPVWITAVAVVTVAVVMWAAPQVKKSPVPESARPAAAAAAVAAAPPIAKPSPVPSAAGSAVPSPAPDGESYLDGLERAGLHNLDVDQMVALKIHGVTPEYIAAMKSLSKDLGWSEPDVDQLVAFKIHGVDADSIRAIGALGLKPDADEMVALRIHGVTPDFVKSWRDTGLKDLDIDTLLSLKIHGANPADVRELQSLGFSDLSAEDVVQVRIMGVTPAFIRDVKKRGLTNLKLEQLIQLKQFGILDSKERN